MWAQMLKQNLLWLFACIGLLGMIPTCRGESPVAKFDLRPYGFDPKESSPRHVDFINGYFLVAFFVQQTLVSIDLDPTDLHMAHQSGRELSNLTYEERDKAG